MIAKSIDIIRKNWALYLVFIGLLTFALGLQDAGYFQSGGSAGITIVWLLLARYIHRCALLNRKFGEGNADGTADTRFIGFMLKALLLGAVAVALALPVLFFTLPSSPGGINALSYLALIVAFLFSYSAVLALAGSWLPADVYGLNKGIGAALKRGTASFRPVFARVFGVTFIAVIVPILLAVFFSGAGLSTSIVVEGSLNIAGLMLTVLFQALQCIWVTITAVILSNYYLSYEHLTAGQP
jgi:hypothetical protein